MTLTSSLCYKWIGWFSPDLIPAQAAESSSAILVTIDGEKLEETMRDPYAVVVALGKGGPENCTLTQTVEMSF